MSSMGSGLMDESKLLRLPRWTHFLIAILLSAIVLIFRRSISVYMGDSAPFLFSSIAVLVSAFIGGLWPGLLATVMTTAGGIIFFLLPQASADISDPRHRILIGANITVCVSISLICGALRSSEIAAADSAQQERMANDRLRVLINSITDALIIFSRDLKILSYNQAAKELWGLDNLERDAEMAKALPSEVYEALIAPAKTALELGISSSIQVTVDDLSTTFDVLSFPSDEGLMVYFRDVTARVAASAEIDNLVEEQRRVNAFLDSLLSHAPLGFAFFSKDYRFERINEVLAEMNGLPIANHIGRTTRELMPLNADFIEPIIDRVFATGEAVDQLEMTGQTPKEPGVIRHWLSGFYPVSDSKGIVRAVGTVVIEITQRKMIEEQLRESEERFRNLADDTPMMIWICNPDGSANWFNRPWLSFRNITLDAALCEGCFANIHADDEPWVKETYQEALAKGEPFSVEYRTLAANGEYRWLHVKANPVHHDGRLTSYLMSSIDVTDRTTMEEHLRRSLANERVARGEAEKANRLKDEFLAGLSHELRTPLTTMLGWAELLMRPKVREAELMDGLQTIQRSSKLQLQLINDLLDMSRISVGKIVLEFEYAELFDAVQSVVNLVQPSAAEKDITVSLASPPDPIIVRIDPDRFTQILWNLLSNALRFTPKNGQVTVDIRSDETTATISVVDTGIGLDEDFLPYVFDRFRQADAGRSRKHGGLGLGLAIAKQLVELHEGSISVHSEGTDKGSTFSITLPLAKTVSLPDKKSEKEENGQSDSTRRLVDICILLVEDDPSSRDLLKRILELEGAVVVAVGSAPEARKVIREVSPDVLVSDIGLPEEDGFQLMRSIRSGTASEFESIPAIALTAFASGNDRIRAFEAGFSLFLTKPVDGEDLIGAVLEARTQQL